MQPLSHGRYGDLIEVMTSARSVGSVVKYSGTMVKPMPLYTIGYQQRTVSEFVEALRSAGVTVVVDVRENPMSRKPGFSKNRLKENLERAGIGYIHARFAGTPRAFRNESTSHEETLRLHARHLDRHPEVLAEFDQLIAAIEADGGRAAIMCFERDPAECHRSELARRWKALGRRRGVVDL